MVKKGLFVLLLFMAQIAKSQIQVKMSAVNIKETNDKYLMVCLKNIDSVSYFIRDMGISRCIFLYDVENNDTINKMGDFKRNSFTLCEREDLKNFEKIDLERDILLYEPPSILLNNMKNIFFEYMNKNEEVFENVDSVNFATNYIEGIIKQIVFFKPNDYYFYMLNLCLLEEKGGTYEFIFNYTGNNRPFEYYDTVSGFNFELPDKIGEFQEFNDSLNSSIMFQFK